MAKMSRRMPPTPVAAPWKGSTALGWLCDSTLNAHTRPPPTSTAPAFSPGPMTTCSPSVGSVRSSFLECLYAQCSLHSSEYIASSTWLGAPSCFSQTSSYSAAVSPSASASRRVGNVEVSGMRPLQRQAHGLEDLQAVRRAARQLVHRMLRMGHQAEHVAALVAHARYVVDGAVEVLTPRVAQHQLAAMDRAGQLVLRYARGENFNGSVHDIAGVCNERGNVFGLMPHPEHAVDELTGGSADGLKIFQSMRLALEEAHA